VTDLQRSLFIVFTGVSTLLFACFAAAQQPPTAAGPAPNSDPVYQQLRQIKLSGEMAAVKDLVLKRDAGKFTLRSGAFYFVTPVEGKVTGGVFIGDAIFTLDPPLESERRSLALLTKDSSEFVEEFSQAVFFFTDATYDEIRKAIGVTNASLGSAASALLDVQNALRKKLEFNLPARILQDVIGTAPGSLFVAFIKGRKYNDKILYAVDPYGVPDFLIIKIAPEEVALMTWDDNKWGVWSAFHLSEEYKTGKATGTQANWPIDIQRQKLDTRIDKSAKLNGNAQTTFVSRVDGLRVVPFDLFPKLRVQSVTSAEGQHLSFIQEDKDEDAQFFVILPKPLTAGERVTLTTVYSGKDAVINEGSGNYFPVARHNWYPNSSFGDYAAYEMRFVTPKNLKIIATGTPLSEKTQGDEIISDWKTEVPQAVAGFNFGKFKREQAKLEKEDYLVESYANENPPDFVRSIQQAVEQFKVPVALGTMSTTSMIKKPLAEAQLAISLYTNYFGPAPYKRIAMTQQTACTAGQAWPGLVYIPICSFFDSTVRHELSLDRNRDLRAYWRVVGPHEVAHQWWGHVVGFSSYRDQWMSEGFSHLSASLFLQFVEKNNKDFIKFWEDQLEVLTERNKEGFRPIDVGPVTLGYRLMSTRTGFDIPGRLIYPKGGYILHMLRMMMWNQQTGDERFRAMMQEFVKTYTNRAATTEDFKAVVEKHLTPEMNLDGNGKMDWFFNQYVYGTALPSYRLDHSFNNGSDGTHVLKLKITQSNVDPQFKMLVPLYLELSDGRVTRLGSAAVTGNNSVNAEVPLKGLKDRPKRAVISYYQDVLGLIEK
jgi:hypothetical protein